MEGGRFRKDWWRERERGIERRESNSYSSNLERGNPYQMIVLGQVTFIYPIRVSTKMPLVLNVLNLTLTITPVLN
jgi:hypothetical protein